MDPQDHFDPLEYRLRYMNLVAATDLPSIAATAWAASTTAAANPVLRVGPAVEREQDSDQSGPG